MTLLLKRVCQTPHAPKTRIQTILFKKGGCPGKCNPKSVENRTGADTEALWRQFKNNILVTAHSTADTSVAWKRICGSFNHVYPKTAQNTNALYRMFCSYHAKNLARLQRLICIHKLVTNRYAHTFSGIGILSLPRHSSQ